MRYATKEERDSVHNYIESISKPTGINFFDTKEVSIMANTKEVLYDNINNIPLSDKVNKIQSLPNLDNKDTVVQEIEALEIFTEEERASIFGNTNIVWILKSYSIKELKEKAIQALQKPEVNIGDIVTFGYPETKGIVLEICGESKDRLTIMHKEVTEYNSSFAFTEGVSIYNIKATGKHVETEFLNVL